MTRRVPVPLPVLTVAVLVVALFNIGGASPAGACGPGVDGVRVGGEILCTHGEGEAPAGVETTELPTTDELLEARYGDDSAGSIPAEEVPGEPTVAAAGTVACIGDGVSGARVQLVYARASNVDSRYSSVLPLLRQYASDSDDIINVSAGRVGDGRRVRYVTNNDCVPQVLNVELSSTGDDNFTNMVSELRNQGLTSADRKYLVFMDAAVGICGLGEVYLNDRGDELNPNNTGRAMYSRVDASCWQYAAAHEMLHNLGAVQNTAPNSSGAGHCTDEVDVMCYRDTSTTVTRVVCDRAGQVDCNNNDYFHPNPNDGSYLDNKWNVARSRYLESSEAPPLPSKTTVSVPASGLAGVPWEVRANVSTADAAIVWSTTRDDCWFENPQQAVTSWTCPATATGQGEITVHVTEDGITTPYTSPVSLVVPSAKLPASATLSASTRRITTGQNVEFTARFNATGTGAPVAELPIVFESRDKKSTVWKPVKTAATTRNGLARLEASPERNKTYRVRSTSNDTWDNGRSNYIEISVAHKMSTKVNSKMIAGFSGSYVRRNTQLVIEGAVSPDKAGRTIKLKRYRDGRWKTIRSEDLSSRSTYNFHFTPGRKGKMKLRVVKPGDTRNTKTGRIIRFTVS